jgi:hypothetical protein
MSEAAFSLRKHIVYLWKAAAELRVASVNEPAHAAVLRRMADQLEAEAEELEEKNSRAKPVGFV